MPGRGNGPARGPASDAAGREPAPCRAVACEGEAGGRGGRLLRPLARPGLRRLCAGRLLSTLADWLLLATLVGWLYAAQGTGAAVLLLLARLAPPLVGGGAAAALADRLPRRVLLVGVEGLRLVAAATALAGIAGDRPLVVLAAAAAGGLLVPVAGVAVRSSVPLLVPAHELPAANGVLGLGQEAAMALGALGAGGSLLAVPAAPVVAAAILLSAGAALAYTRLPRLGFPPAPEALSEPVSEPGAGLRAGLRHLTARPQVLVAVLAFSAATVATGLTNATLPALLGSELGLGSGGYGFGLGALAVGLALGQALGGLLPVARATTATAAAALAAMALPLAGLAAAPSAAVALGLLCLVGVADGASEVVFDTIAQRECDPRFLGRILGLASTAMTTTMVGAVALAPLVERLASPRLAVAGAAAGLAAVAVATLLGGAYVRPAPAARLAPSA